MPKYINKDRHQIWNNCGFKNIFVLQAFWSQFQIFEAFFQQISHSFRIQSIAPDKARKVGGIKCKEKFSVIPALLMQ